jgi:hypothetical protein
METVIKFITESNLSDLGSAASIASLIITVCGFVITIITVVTAKRAVQKVRADMAQFDIASELSAALAEIEEIKNLHRGGGWQYISPRYSGLRKSLIAIREVHPDMSDQHRTHLQSTITHLGTMETQVEEALSHNAVEALSVPRFNGIISVQADQLNEMLVQIKNKIGR